MAFDDLPKESTGNELYEEFTFSERKRKKHKENLIARLKRSSDTYSNFISIREERKNIVEISKNGADRKSKIIDLTDEEESGSTWTTSKQRKDNYKLTKESMDTNKNLQPWYGDSQNAQTAAQTCICMHASSQYPGQPVYQTCYGHVPTHIVIKLNPYFLPVPPAELLRNTVLFSNENEGNNSPPTVPVINQHRKLQNSRIKHKTNHSENQEKITRNENSDDHESYRTSTKKAKLNKEIVKSIIAKSSDFTDPSSYPNKLDLTTLRSKGYEKLVDSLFKNVIAGNVTLGELRRMKYHEFVDMFSNDNPDIRLKLMSWISANSLEGEFK